MRINIPKTRWFLIFDAPHQSLAPGRSIPESTVRNHFSRQRIIELHEVAHTTGHVAAGSRHQRCGDLPVGTSWAPVVLALISCSLKMGLSARFRLDRPSQMHGFSPRLKTPAQALHAIDQLATAPLLQRYLLPLQS